MCPVWKTSVYSEPYGINGREDIEIIFDKLWSDGKGLYIIWLLQMTLVMPNTVPGNTVRCHERAIWWRLLIKIINLKQHQPHDVLRIWALQANDSCVSSCVEGTFNYDVQCFGQAFRSGCKARLGDFTAVESTGLRKSRSSHLACKHRPGVYMPSELGCGPSPVPELSLC